MGMPGKVVVAEISLAVKGPPGIGFQGQIQESFQKGDSVYPKKQSL